MDISESLKAAENSIRDTISFVLTKKVWRGLAIPFRDIRTTTCAMARKTAR